jgi:hypothetical protein
MVEEKERWINMTEAAILIALLLHRPIGLVGTVYEMGGLSAVVVVEYESEFCITSYRKEKDGFSYGLFQLYDKCHEQYRDDLLLHIVYGVRFWRECMAKGKTIARAYSYFNSGNARTSIEKGREVQRKYDSLAKYIWRRMR